MMYSTLMHHNSCFGLVIEFWHILTNVAFEDEEFSRRSWNPEGCRRAGGAVGANWSLVPTAKSCQLPTKTRDYRLVRFRIGERLWIADIQVYYPEVEGLLKDMMEKAGSKVEQVMVFDHTTLATIQCDFMKIGSMVFNDLAGLFHLLTLPQTTSFMRFK